MEYPTNEQLKDQIKVYYGSKLSSGITCEVKNLSLSEETEGGGKNVTATLSFLTSHTGAKDESKILIPCDESGNLDWTSSKFLDDTHSVDPSKASHPTVKSPAPLPKNNKKPDTSAKPPGEKVDYIQKPEKVGAQGGKKIKASKQRRLGYDEDGWPTPDQLELEEKQMPRIPVTEGYVHGQDETLSGDWIVEDTGTGDDFDPVAEAGISPAMMAGAVSKLNESYTSPEGYVYGQDMEENEMKAFTPKATNGENIPVALIEYRAKSLVEGTEDAVFEFGLLFESEEVRDEAKATIEGADGIAGVELIEDVGLAVACLKNDEYANPHEQLTVISETLGLQLHWDNGQKEKYQEEMTHNYSDNKGTYHSGVQTDANEPGKANPGGDQMSPGDTQGGPKKRKHAKTSGDQGGDGLGGASAQSTPSVKPDGKEATKSAGQQATESLEEQDFLDDVMSYDSASDAMSDGEGEEDDMGDEMEPEGETELDDTIMSLVAAQAEAGIDVILQVAQETMGELTPEMEQEIRDTFAEYAQDGGGEEEMDVEVSAVSIDAETDDEEDDESENPFESQEVDEDSEIQEDVEINISDTASEAPVATETPTVSMDTSPTVSADTASDVADDAGTSDSDTEPSEKPDESEEEDDDEDKPSKDEALTVLRNGLVDELVEMDELDSVLAVENLDEAELLIIDEALPPPGEGGRFKKLKKDLGDEGAKDPAALASWIGRKKYGKKKFQNMAAAGESLIGVGQMAKTQKAKELISQGISVEEAAQKVGIPLDELEYDLKQKYGKSSESLSEEGGLSGQTSTVTGWAANQPAPNQPLSFVGDDAYSFAQKIAAKDPTVRTAKVLKPGKFSKTTSRHANMVANRLAKQGYNVNRVDGFDNNPDYMTVGELDNQMGLGLPEESLIKLSPARFKKESIEKLTDEQKAQLKEKLIAKGNKLAEDQQNQNTYGGTQSVQRVKGTKKAYNMFGRLKPGVKWKGLVRVVWDDGNESWEKPGDVKSVGANAYNVKSPSGGPTSPASNQMSQAGGEELDMLKNLESIKKTPREKRFDKAVESVAKVEKMDEDKLVEAIVSDWDEFERVTFNVDKLVESLQPEPEPEPIEESEEEDDEEEDEIHLVMEDFGFDEDDDGTTTLTEDE